MHLPRGGGGGGGANRTEIHLPRGAHRTEDKLTKKTGLHLQRGATEDTLTMTATLRVTSAMPCQKLTMARLGLGPRTSPTAPSTAFLTAFLTAFFIRGSVFFVFVACF